MRNDVQVRVATLQGRIESSHLRNLGEHFDLLFDKSKSTEDVEQNETPCGAK